MDGVSVAELGRLDDVRVTAGRHPLPSMLSLLADALGVRPQGVPPAWRRAVASACAPHAAGVLSPAVAPGTLWVPDVLAPSPLGGRRPEEEFEAIRETPAEALAADLTADFPEGVPVRWQRVLDRPRRFVDDYVTLMTGLWQWYAPHWRGARELMDREVARIGTAAVSGSVAALLTTLSPRVSFADTALTLPDPCGRAASLRDRRVTLVPLLSGTTASVVSLDRADAIWVGYPLPGLREVWGTRPRAPLAPDPLEAVLGTMRAHLLRHARHHPTMGRLSTLLVCAPSAVTHHCGLLERAGLVRRERHGQHVRVLLTARGRHLLALLTD
ncbi:hypothetical protein [Streptomyces chumphonensis]|uniref:hypothetical protein n=1 Tax=Streptomyces chumphonensis TaxID=1214925 RepID=UPI003D754B65